MDIIVSVASRVNKHLNLFCRCGVAISHPSNLMESNERSWSHGNQLTRTKRSFNRHNSLLVVFLCASQGKWLSVDGFSTPLRTMNPAGPFAAISRQRLPRLSTQSPENLSPLFLLATSSAEKADDRIQLPPFVHCLCQWTIVAAAYSLDLFVTSRHHLILPVQMQIGGAYFSTIGYDSLAGILVALAYWNKSARAPFPFSFPKDSTWHRLTFLITVLVLVPLYFQTGIWSQLWKYFLYEHYGHCLNMPQVRSWTVLLGHLSWVVAGMTMLTLIPAGPRFWGRSQTDNQPDEINVEKKERNHFYWFQWASKKQRWWGLWVAGGFLVSNWLFQIADWITLAIFSPTLLEPNYAVAELVAPENNDVIATIVGFVAPCLSAPFYEEMLYRGFMLPGLTDWTGRWWISAIVQAAVFSAHHVSLTGSVSLFVLGLAWSILYRQSGSLFVPSLVHVLWNSRVFVSSWLGL